ncbi:hypothetical protein AB2L57_10675 [Microbacterium sp. HA-8]|uniref:hypothetical protein n=1 Tax=Microbacterium sp. HA-8 TaxID=3234200 RepID=UPI0038F79B8F
MTGGAAVGVAVTKGSYRALRHSEGVALLLWQAAERIAQHANEHIETSSVAEHHFLVDGARGREGNRKASYRTTARTYTKAAVYHQHDDHLLEAAIAALKAQGI